MIDKFTWVLLVVVECQDLIMQELRKRERIKDESRAKKHKQGGKDELFLNVQVTEMLAGTRKNNRVNCKEWWERKEKCAVKQSEECYGEPYSGFQHQCNCSSSMVCKLWLSSTLLPFIFLKSMVAGSIMAFLFSFFRIQIFDILPLVQWMWYPFFIHGPLPTPPYSSTFCHVLSSSQDRSRLPINVLLSQSLPPHWLFSLGILFFLFHINQHSFSKISSKHHITCEMFSVYPTLLLLPLWLLLPLCCQGTFTSRLFSVYYTWMFVYYTIVSALWYVALASFYYILK